MVRALLLQSDVEELPPTDDENADNEQTSLEMKARSEYVCDMSYVHRLGELR